MPVFLSNILYSRALVCKGLDEVISTKKNVIFNHYLNFKFGYFS